ncbi:hypothetical protein F442_15850 [Phytophthora nicotianae P10297]|uniref:Uncharacterized protein n=4 Tax=Phytophthora nicotianae TaxID=4792 RepID=V9EI22_PHYNI|nr:hypothetical protein F443_16004 [Phytophthora nicotianae P1569]ETL85068.1 hypothetical protein L917_15270 [Phytophthora nicotianae]ETO66969.1 hypothetical protein F444_15985 [Phytophthora nicotianae P1976]ETP36120.1 hypothetical protein F442_15850 [Phytophthora nicotianae P10297]
MPSASVCPQPRKRHLDRVSCTTGRSSWIFWRRRVAKTCQQSIRCTYVSFSSGRDLPSSKHIW